MKICKVERFEVNGKEFKTLAKAQDYVDSEVNRLLTNALGKTNLMLSLTDIVKITEVILENREELAELLSVESETDNDEWDSRDER